MAPRAVRTQLKPPHPGIEALHGMAPVPLLSLTFLHLPHSVRKNHLEFFELMPTLPFGAPTMPCVPSVTAHVTLSYNNVDVWEILKDWN